MLLAIAEKPLVAMDDLLRAISGSLPPVLYVHVTAPLLDTLAERWTIETAEPHLKLALARNDLLADHAVPVEILGPADLEDIETLMFELRLWVSCEFSSSVITQAPSDNRETLKAKPPLQAPSPSCTATRTDRVYPEEGASDARNDVRAGARRRHRAPRHGGQAPPGFRSR